MNHNVEKFKICPVCNTSNPPYVLECTECGNDLLGVRIVDETYLEKQKDTPTAQTIKEDVKTEDLVRICECGAENEVSARKCAVCGEDISDILPTARKKETQTSKYSLVSFDNHIKLDLSCPGEHIIGRENELSDYLESKTYVSRRHAKLTVTTEGIFIENLSKSNGTYINNVKMDEGIAYKLCCGDKLGLGGFESKNGRQDLAAYFEIKKE